MPQDTQQLPFATGRTVYSVAALNQSARELVETHFGTIWVEGEISNFARPSSGHMYFSLKDEHAQLRCAMFRQHNRQLGFRPGDGQHVIARGRLSIYEARGDFQLIVDSIEEAGLGLLRRRFEALKAKLEAEGLFSADRKLPIPLLPNRIGVITSATGAAVHDILTALQRRFPAVAVLIYPSAVQGENAARQLAAALDRANRRAECDVLILARGGGSLEDLWAFNEEILARAIADSNIPVICGVGHETDFTIADFVADLRAPTPSQAAELAVPDQRGYLQLLRENSERLARAIRDRFRERRHALQILGHRFERTHPGVQLRERAQRLDDAEAGLRAAIMGVAGQRARQLAGLELRLASRNPAARAALLSSECDHLRRRMAAAMRMTHDSIAHRLSLAGRALDSLSPLATLERGYSIVTQRDPRALVTDAQQVAAGKIIDIQLHHGSVSAQVKSTHSDDKKDSPVND